MNKAQKIVCIVFAILAIVLITNQLINDFTFQL